MVATASLKSGAKSSLCSEPIHRTLPQKEESPGRFDSELTPCWRVRVRGVAEAPIAAA